HLDGVADNEVLSFFIAGDLNVADDALIDRQADAAVRIVLDVGYPGQNVSLVMVRAFDLVDRRRQLIEILWLSELTGKQLGNGFRRKNLIAFKGKLSHGRVFRPPDLEQHPTGTHLRYDLQIAIVEITEPIDCFEIFEDLVAIEFVSPASFDHAQYVFGRDKTIAFHLHIFDGQIRRHNGRRLFDTSRRLFGTSRRLFGSSRHQEELASRQTCLHRQTNYER